MRHRVLKWARFVCLFVCLFFVVVGVELWRLRSTALIMSLFRTRKMADACLVCLYNKRHQAVESPSHVHRFSVNSNCSGIYVSMGWIALEEKPGKIGKQWCDRCDAQVTERECFYWPEECEIVYRPGFPNVNIVFLTLSNSQSKYHCSEFIWYQ